MTRRMAMTPTGLAVLTTPTPRRQTLSRKTVDAIGTRRNDLLRSGRSGSFLNGWSGSDQIVGRAGPDRLLGGAGNDVLTGGGGRDRFIFSATPNYPEGLERCFQRALLGVDRISDFVVGQDQIILDAGTVTRLVGDGQAVARPVRFAVVPFRKG
jgi:Ca2+-binding RTX toxin-like protein